MLIALAPCAGATFFTARECSDYMSARFHPDRAEEMDTSGIECKVQTMVDVSVTEGLRYR